MYKLKKIKITSKNDGIKYINLNWIILKQGGLVFFNPPVYITIY